MTTEPKRYHGGGRPAGLRRKEWDGIMSNTKMDEEVMKCHQVAWSMRVEIEILNVC